MSRTFTSKAATTSRGRGRGTNSSNLGRGSIINRGEKREQQGPSNISAQSGHNVSALSTNRLSNTAANSRTRGTPNTRRTPNTKPITNTRGGRGRGRAKMYDDDMPDDMPFNSKARTRTNSQSNQAGQAQSTPTNDNTNQDRTTHSTGYTMVSPNEKKRQAITQQAKKNLEDYERHKEERRIHHVSYVGTAGGGSITEEEARRKAAKDLSRSAYDTRTKRESYKAAEKEREEMVYKDRKMAARRQSELNEEKRKKDADRQKEDMRRKNAAFLDRLEANKPKPTATVHSNQDNVTRDDVSAPILRLGAQAPVEELEHYASDVVNEDLNSLQVMFPHYTRNDLSELLQQMGSLELTIDILSE